MTSSARCSTDGADGEAEGLADLEPGRRCFASRAWPGFRPDERLHSLERRLVGGGVGADGRAPGGARIVEARRLSGVTVHEPALRTLLEHAAADILHPGE